MCPLCPFPRAFMGVVGSSRCIFPTENEKTRLHNTLSQWRAEVRGVAHFFPSSPLPRDSFRFSGRFHFSLFPLLSSATLARNVNPQLESREKGTLSYQPFASLSLFFLFSFFFLFFCAGLNIYANAINLGNIREEIRSALSVPRLLMELLIRFDRFANLQTLIASTIDIIIII